MVANGRKACRESREDAHARALRLRTGTTILDTYDFINNVINGPNGIGDAGGAAGTPMHTFVCDNLTSHHSPLISQLVNQHGHHLVFRAPYNPWDGPIEYFFNYLQMELSLLLYRIRTPQELQLAINQICQGANGEFGRYFAHCGYDP